MTLVIDIDDTLIIANRTYCEKCNYIKYGDTKAIQEEIDRVNKHYKNGDTIILHTGRGWNQYDLTVEQLKKHGVKYHQLICGRPVGTYVDKDAIKSLKELD